MSISSAVSSCIKSITSLKETPLDKATIDPTKNLNLDDARKDLSPQAQARRLPTPITTYPSDVASTNNVVITQPSATTQSKESQIAEHARKLGLIPEESVKWLTADPTTRSAAYVQNRDRRLEELKMIMEGIEKGIISITSSNPQRQADLENARKMTPRELEALKNKIEEFNQSKLNETEVKLSPGISPHVKKDFEQNKSAINKLAIGEKFLSADGRAWIKGEDGKIYYNSKPNEKQTFGCLEDDKIYVIKEPHGNNIIKNLFFTQANFIEVTPRYIDEHMPFGPTDVLLVDKFGNPYSKAGVPLKKMPDGSFELPNNRPLIPSASGLPDFPGLQQPKHIICKEDGTFAEVTKGKKAIGYVEKSAFAIEPEEAKEIQRIFDGDLKNLKHYSVKRIDGNHFEILDLEGNRVGELRTSIDRKPPFWPDSIRMYEI